MRGPRAGRGRRGASLAEVLVALTVLSIGAAAVVGLLETASRSVRTGEVALRAMLLAGEVSGFSGGPASGEREAPVGVLHWCRPAAGGVVVRYEPPGGGDGEVVGRTAPAPREWRLLPGSEAAGGSC